LSEKQQPAHLTFYYAKGLPFIKFIYVDLPYTQQHCWFYSLFPVKV